MLQQPIKDIVEHYQGQPPEEIFHWHDPLSPAEGILVIDSWAYGACGGGTRITESLDTQEVSALAKVMGLKFQLFGPTIGGAKSCIAIPNDYHDKQGVLARWFAAIAFFLQKGYGTAADLNTDYAMIAHQLHEMGYCHPQQGIWQALGMDKAKCAQIVDKMQVLHAPIALNGCSLALSECITGYGVAQAVRAAYAAQEIDIKGKSAVIQGVGTVGAAAAYYLHQMGARIIALVDEMGGVIKPEGFEDDEIGNVLQSHQLTVLSTEMLNHDDFYRVLSKEQSAIVIPAACAYLNDADMVDAWLERGLEVIACGANLPFSDAAMYGSIAQKLDQVITLIPSCVASAGMARAFSMIMQSDLPKLDTAMVFDDIRQQMNAIIKPAVQQYQGRRVAEVCYQQALQQ